jgi:hypothetical protein
MAIPTPATVVNGFGNDMGTLRLNGEIHSFALGGQELVIDHLCITAAPEIDAEGTWILPYGVGGTRLDAIQPDGLTDYTDTLSSLYIKDAPFGSRLGFRIGTSDDLPNAHIAYYRLLYKQASAVDWIDFDETVAVHYQLEVPSNPPVFPSFVLGPTDFDGKNLYRFRPHEADLPALVPLDTSAGETVSWPASGFLGDIYRGPNRVELAEIRDAEVSALSAGTAGIFGTAYEGDGSGNFERPFGRYELLNCCGQHCIEAAFSANLHVLAKATNGWHRRLNSLDSHAVRAFALTPR